MDCNIKNLLFDLGGVIMDIRRDNAVDALRELGVDNADDLLGAFGQKGIFLQLERGEITPEQFRNELRGQMSRPASDEQIDAAFCRFLLGIPVDRLRQLEQLHRSYKLYLLSNTNALMWYSTILPEFRKDGHDIDFYFDGVVTSFEVHAYKPDAEIFHIAERICGIKPCETVFFDDSRANIDAARALGFKAVCVDNPSQPYASYLENCK